MLHTGCFASAALQYHREHLIAQRNGIDLLHFEDRSAVHTAGLLSKHLMPSYAHNALLLTIHTHLLYIYTIYTYT
jgi:hypothetical protein